MEVTYPAPDGTAHLVVALPGAAPGLALGLCSTCGAVHDIGHALTRARLFEAFENDPPCRYARLGSAIWCVTHHVRWITGSPGKGESMASPSDIARSIQAREGWTDGLDERSSDDGSESEPDFT
jgi:hypothetical protein